MIQLRAASDRGHADYGWLVTHYSFSFGDYYDPGEMGWGALRVINDDFIAPGSGFGPHGHKDMEILTYVLSGTLEHRDSLGHGGRLGPGEVQRMSAGRGIRHSEVNPSPDTPLRLLQIWIEPGQPGREPGYEQRPVPDEAKRGRLLPIASPDGREGSTTLGQDALVYASLLAPGEGLDYTLAPERLAYVHLIRGELEINGVPLSPGDGAKIAPEPRRDHLAFRIPSRPETVMSSGQTGTPDLTEFLLFDLPPL